jgi:RHS repeat-associated protein
LQRTSATVYDAIGDVTAATDSLGRVTATDYDPLGQDTADYQGQIVNSITGAPGYATCGSGPTAASNWTFSKLSPNNQLSYDVYVYSANGSADTSQDNYSLSGASFLPQNDPAAPSLGAGWSLLGTLSASASTVAVSRLTDATGLAPGEVCLMQQTSATAYDPNGNVTAQIDGTGRVTASAYNDMGDDTADYQGQVLTNVGPSYTSSGSGAGTVSHWTFSNLVPNSFPAYEVYGYSTAASFSGSGFTAGGNTLGASASTTPSLGANWYPLGTATVSASASALTVSYTGTPPTALCLLQQTAATGYDDDGEAISTTNARGYTTDTAYNVLGQETKLTQPDPNNGQQDSSSPTTQTIYDAEGNVTATIDPLGRVTATTYDDFGQAAETYQGQTLSGPSVTFKNLTPNSPATYDIYTTSGGTPTITGIYSAAPNDATHPSLGPGWTYCKTITSTATSLALSSNSSDNFCLLQQTSTTVYDDDGNATATISALGRVTATAYDEDGQDVADYQGQVLAVSGGSATFSNLAPNYQNWYDVYTQGGSLTSATTGNEDPNAPYLGQGWTYAGEVAVTQGTTSSTLNVSGANPTVCLLQVATSTACDADGNVTATVDGMGRVTASYFDHSGNDVADYQGQVLNGASSGYSSSPYPNWTFNNLTPNAQSSYDLYGWSARAALTGTGYAVVRSPSESFTLSGNTYAPYGTYDGAGTWYCAGNNTYAWFDGSEWQISAVIGTAGTTHSSDGATGLQWLIGGTSATASAGVGSIESAGESGLGSPAADPAAPSLGDGWCLLGTVTVSANTTSLQVSYTYSGDNPAPPSAVCLLQQTTATTYDDDGNALTVTDALGHTTTRSYNDLDQLVSTKDPDGYTTTYSYDADGNVLTETDPDNNTTSYTYNDASQVTSKTQSIQTAYGANPTDVANATVIAETTYQYDADGNLVETADALANGGSGTGNVIVYAYNALDQQTGEYWYSTISAANNDTAGRPGALTTISSAYDADGELSATAEKAGTTPVCGYKYTYTSLGQQASVDNNATGYATPGVPDVVLSSTYDADGNRKSLSATVGGTADFVNTYSYDSSHREVQITQGPAAGKSNVDPKTVSFTYDADGEVSTIDRFNALNTGSGEVVKTTYGYDSFGRVTGLTHSTSTPITDAWTYDADSEVKSFSDSANPGDDFSGCTYDSDGQLESDTGGFDPVNNSYDQNGNATSLDVGVTSTSVGAGNTVLFDGSRNYQYNADGEVVLSWQCSSGQAAPTNSDTGTITSYSWDNRGRLISVTIYHGYTNYAADTFYQKVAYTYDMFNNLIERTVSGPGAGLAAGTQRYVFDGTNMVLAFDGSENLTDRYLWGPAVDQVLADENFVAGSCGESANNGLPTSAGTTYWSLADNQNSVTDLVNDGGADLEHIDYSAFGQAAVASTSVPAGYNFPVGYTGTYTDPTTGCQLHGLRWYDPAGQRWLSQDPSGLDSGDANLYRYCGNAPTDGMDPTGRILCAFDGTWDDADNGTNVRKFYEGDTGPKLYLPGVGTMWSDGITNVPVVSDFSTLTAKNLGGAVGSGFQKRLDMMQGMLDAYFRSQTKDREVDIIGFSRGAALARAFANQIQPLLKTYRARIRFIGVWDTVATLGVAGDTGGYNLTLPRSLDSKNAFHAMSFSEKRAKFGLVRYKGAKEVWFGGDHCDVGGGWPEDERTLANYALRWMAYHARKLGVPVDASVMTSGDMDPTHCVLHDNDKGKWVLFDAAPTAATDPRVVQPGDEVHASAVFAWYATDGAAINFLYPEAWNFAGHYALEFQYRFGNPANKNFADAKINNDDSWRETYAKHSLDAIP